MRESDIYNKLSIRATNPLRIGPDYGDPVSTKQDHDIEELSLEHLEGVFIMYIIGIAISLFLFLSELIRGKNAPNKQTSFLSSLSDHLFMNNTPVYIEPYL